MKRRLKVSSGAGLIGDVLRKASLSGVGEIRLPGELRRALVSNIEKLRENAVDAFSNEISKVLSKVDVGHIIDDVLQNYTLKVRVDLVPKGRAAQRAKARNTKAVSKPSKDKK